MLALALCESPPSVDNPALWIGRIRDWMLSRQAPAAPAAPFDCDPAAAIADSRPSSRYYC